jgi:serine/threonine-protein kinase
MPPELVGRYRLVRKLANGGMGEIFLAEAVGEAGFRRPVVIKRLFGHLLQYGEAVSMFQNEAHVLAQLSHPNIPQVYDLGMADDRWFLAIEYVPGHTLTQIVEHGLAAATHMPLDVTLAVVIQLCEALHHALERHAADGAPLRIVHRDVSPTYVMVTPDVFAKLLDFGVARQGLQETKGGALRGTLSYMAPEQVRSQRLDKRSDVFAVGVLLYELTTGTRLFTGSEVEVMRAIVERDVIPPSQFIAGYPADLEAIILTALARDRGQRWPSAAHLERALEEYAGRHGIVATHRVTARFYQSLFELRRMRTETRAAASVTSVNYVETFGDYAQESSDSGRRELPRGPHDLATDGGAYGSVVEADSTPSAVPRTAAESPVTLGAPKRRKGGPG